MALRCGALCCWMVALAVALAADFWEEKDFLAWSDDEVEEMLLDSPWSREVTVALWFPPTTASRPRTPGVDGGPEHDGGLRRVPDRESTGGRGRSGGFSPMRLLTLTVSWRSALPVKQALVRRQVGPQYSSPLPFDQWAFLVQLEPLYVVSVSGLPRSFGRLAQNRDGLRAEASLRRDGKQPIPAEDVEVFLQNDDTIVVEYAFAKQDPITLQDRTVEFSAVLGEVQVTKKFDIRDMTVAGTLEL